MPLNNLLLIVICLLVLVYILNHYFRFIKNKRIDMFEVQSVVASSETNTLAATPVTFALDAVPQSPDQVEIVSQPLTVEQPLVKKKAAQIIYPIAPSEKVKSSNANKVVNSADTSFKRAADKSYNTCKNDDCRPTTTLPPIPLTTTLPPNPLTTTLPPIPLTTTLPPNPLTTTTPMTTQFELKNINLILGNSIRQALEKMIKSQGILVNNTCSAENQFN